MSKTDRRAFGITEVRHRTFRNPTFNITVSSTSVSATGGKCYAATVIRLRGTCGRVVITDDEKIVRLAALMDRSSRSC